MNVIRWGFLATGKVAHQFADDLALLPDAEIHAVGSRSAESAQAFARQHQVARTYDSYAAVLEDPEVDVVYVATHHPVHAELVRASLDAGKPVLCEKPLTMTAAEAADLVDQARAAGLFLAEAMWMRCNPSIRRVRQMVLDGMCGDVRQVRADLGFVAAPDRHRLWRADLGASALLDIGIYPLTFATMMLGDHPEAVAATAVLDGGFDVGGGAVLTYATGAVAHVSWTQVAWSDGLASVAGDGGRIEVGAQMHCPPSFTYFRNWESDTYSEPVIGLGLANEAAEVMRCLRAGEIESPMLPWGETVETLALIDRIRELWEDTTT